MIYSKILFTLVIFSNLSIAGHGNWLDPVKDEPEGTHYRSFFSPTIQDDVSYLVYLPPDYETAKSRDYPVVYWLHGGGGNQRTGDNFVERLNDAICRGAAPAMIAVLVNGVGGSLFCDSIDGNKPVETVIVKDLIPHIDATYRTYGTSRMRAVEGFSMGGFGALHLAFKYPHLFGAATALAHAPIRPDSGWPKVDRVWKTGPLAGNVEYFRKNDPFQLVEKNANSIRQGMRIRLIVGDADNPNTVARTREFYDKMTGLYLPCELIVIPGIKHSYMNLYEELGDKEFAFYKEVFAIASSSAGANTSKAPGLQTAAITAAPTPMKGLYASLKPPETDEKADAFLRKLQGNPCLTGVLLAAKWNEIESEEGCYDFSRLDRCVELVRKAGKQYKFKVVTGIYSPEYIYKTGAVRFDTVIANPNRSTYGDRAAIPVPWDPVFQRHFSRLIKTFGERYASDPHCVAVTLTCANYMSAEMHLPKSPEDMRRWTEVGLTSDKLLRVYCQYMDEWATAFRRQLICLHMSKTTNLSDVSPNEFVERVALYGLEKYPRRFALQNNGLNGRKENRGDPGHPLFKFKDRLLNGYQSLASFDRTPERQGSIEMAALNFVHVDAEYWELWEADGMNAETCRKVQGAVDDARRLGYEGYRKKLIETGRYRRAEDDHWTPPTKGTRKRTATTREGTQVVRVNAEGESQEPKKDRPVDLPNKAEKMSWVEPDKTEPPGTTYKTFHSKTIDSEVSYLIYLPPDYDKERKKRYPVLYWLHGSGATQSKGGGIVKIMDQAIRDSKAPAMVIVLINGLRGATMYCDSKNGKWPIESVIVNDLIPHIDATYRTTNKREGRAVEGFSMGGFGAAHLGFKYPDIFGVVSILAPALLGPDIKADMPKGKWIEHFSFVFKEDIDYFHANDPFQLIGKNAEKLRGRSIIRLVPHDEEGKWLIPRCEAMHAMLEKHEIAHTFDIRTDIKAHNYNLMYNKIGEKAVGFYANAFAASSSGNVLNPAIAPVKGEQTAVGKPLTDMTAEDRYKGEDGGLYGRGKNSPPDAHLKAAIAEAAKIMPLDAKGQPSPNGKIVLMTHGMSNTTMESQRFIEVANADPRKNPTVILVDGAQGGMDSRKWVEDKHTRSGASPWDRLDQRIKSAGAAPQQVQVIWMKHAISMKHDAARRKRVGEFPDHARQLKDDMGQLVGMLKKRYPNLKFVYVSSRSYAGYATTPLNPEPYAYESAFAVRWLIQDQIADMASLRYTAGKLPLLLWGPYLWADGEKGRNYDDLMYRREDFRDDGTHPSDTGQQKIAEQMLKFFKTDPTAKIWFLKH